MTTETSGVQGICEIDDDASASVPSTAPSPHAVKDGSPKEGPPSRLRANTGLVLLLVLVALVLMNEVSHRSAEASLKSAQSDYEKPPSRPIASTTATASAVTPSYTPGAGEKAVSTEAEFWKSKYASLQTSYRNLETQHRQLTQQYDGRVKQVETENAQFQRTSVKYQRQMGDNQQDLGAKLQVTSGTLKNLEVAHDRLTKKHQELTEAHSTLTVQHQQLQTNFNALGVAYAGAMQKNQELSSQCARWETSYNDLQGRMNDLVAKYNENIQDYNNLQNRYRTLYNAYINLGGR